MDVGEPGARTGHEVEVDVHDDFSLNVQVDVVNQAVDGGTDRPLDPVLDRHEAEVDLALGDGLEDRRDGGQRPQLRRGQVGLGQERFLGEGGLRAEIGARMSQAGSQLGRIEQVMDASSLRTLIERCRGRTLHA